MEGAGIERTRMERIVEEPVGAPANQLQRRMDGQAKERGVQLSFFVCVRLNLTGSVLPSKTKACF